jgi:hypothetical protein
MLLHFTRLDGKMRSIGKRLTARGSGARGQRSGRRLPVHCVVEPGPFVIESARRMVSTNVDTTIAGTERCVSCDAPLAGPYCSRCGERTLEPEALTLRHFAVHTVAHELLPVDSAFWRTLRLLFTHPGRLSLEYAAGRRRPYVNPFRLLLIAIVGYALMSSFGFIVTWDIGPLTMSIAPAAVRRSLSVEETIQQIDRYGLLRQQVAAKRAQLASDAARERFHDRLAAFAEPVSFTNVLLLAATLHVVFWRKRRRFLEHVAFSMHALSFVLLSSVTLFVAIRLRFWLGGYLFAIFGLLGLWQFGYLAVAIRRFYLDQGRWGGWLLSGAAAFLLYALNSAFMTAVQVAGAAIALALI